MRLNSLGEVALNDQGQAVAPWLNDVTVGPYQRTIGGDVWQMVTRTAGIVTPVPNITGGCNESCASDGNWMRYLAGFPLAGSQLWSPLDGFCGDIDGPLALTISKDGLMLRLFENGVAVRDIPRHSPFGGVRLKGQIATWFEFNRTPNIVAWDVLSNVQIPVQALPGPQYNPIAFEAPSGKWVLYQIDALGGVCHRDNDPSQGYQFGIKQSVYDPDVIVQGDGCVIGWSDDAGQFKPKTLTVPVLGQGMVPLVIPPPPVDEPVGPRSKLVTSGTANVSAYVGGLEQFPRGVIPLGDSHGMDVQRTPEFEKNGDTCLWFQKFGEVGPESAKNGELLSLEPGSTGRIHMRVDSSAYPVVDTWTGTHWLNKTMEIGRAHAVKSGPIKLRKLNPDGSVISEQDYSRENWVHGMYPAYYFGPDIGTRSALVTVHNNTGIQEGQTTTDKGLHVETRIWALGASWSDWFFDEAPTAFAGGHYNFPGTSAAHKWFLRAGGTRYPPQVPAACVPPPTPVKPPMPDPAPIPTTGVMLPGFVLWPDKPFKSQDGRFTLLYQSDGNLVEYGPQGPLWATGTNGQTVGFVALQGDGNWVVYDKSTKPRWATNTNGKPVKQLIVQNDGNIVLYSATAPVWDTGTVYAPPPIPPIPPIPPGGGGGGSADMHVWPKFGASYATGWMRNDFDAALFGSLNRDAGGNYTRAWAFDAWAIGPNGPGQHAGIVPWQRDSAGVFDLNVPNPLYEERLNAFVRTMNSYSATVQIDIAELYGWSERKSGLLWVPDQNLSPFRRNRNGVMWGHPDDPTFLAMPDWVLQQLIARVCTSVKGLAVAFCAGNELPEKSANIKIADAIRSHFTADWKPRVLVNRQEDTPGQYFNMQVGGPVFDGIAYHGKRDMGYLDEVYDDEPSSRPKTFRQLWDHGPWETPVDAKRVIMSSDGCRASATIENCYDWPVLREVVKDHLKRGFSFEHQSRVKMRPFLENRLDLRADFETEWLLSIRT